MIGLCNHDVGRLDIAMNDAFLVGMLDCVANINKQFQTLAIGQFLGVAVLSNRDTVNQFHHEVGSP